MSRTTCLCDGRELYYAYQINAGECMELEWKGRYQEIISAMVRHGNTVSRTLSDTMDCGNGILLHYQQFQVLEYIIENRQSIFSMNDASSQLSIPQSTFSKTVKQLVESGLVEKYQAVNNRKNIILRPTEKAIRIYSDFAEKHAKQIWQPFFDALNGVDDEVLHAFVRAIDFIDKRILSENSDEIRIVKIKRP